MRSRSKHSLAAHCDSACGRSGLSLSGVTAVTVESDGTPSHHTGSVKYTERSERAPHILVYCAPLSLSLSWCALYSTYLHIYGRYARERERGKERASSEIGVSVGRLGLRGVGRLDTGLGSMHTARPPSLLRAATSRVLPLSTPSATSSTSRSPSCLAHSFSFCLSISSSLSLSICSICVFSFLHLSSLAFPHSLPAAFSLSCIYILLFVLNGRSSLFGFSCALRVEPRQSTNPVRRGETAGTAG